MIVTLLTGTPSFEVSIYSRCPSQSFIYFVSFNFVTRISFSQPFSQTESALEALPFVSTESCALLGRLKLSDEVNDLIHGLLKLV